MSAGQFTVFMFNAPGSECSVKGAVRRREVSGRTGHKLECLFLFADQLDVLDRVFQGGEFLVMAAVIIGLNNAASLKRSSFNVMDKAILAARLSPINSRLSDTLKWVATKSSSSDVTNAIIFVLCGLSG